MIVLHGIWGPPNSPTDRGEFFLWEESSSLPQIKRRGRCFEVFPLKSCIPPFQAVERDIHGVLESLDLLEKVLIRISPKSYNIFLKNNFF